MLYNTAYQQGIYRAYLNDLQAPLIVSRIPKAGVRVGVKGDVYVLV